LLCPTPVQPVLPVYTIGDADLFLPSHGHQVVQADVLPCGEAAFDVPLLLEGVGTGRAQDRAALVDDVLDLVQAERHGHALDEAPPALLQADELEAVIEAAVDQPADRRVQSRAVTASCQIER